MDERASTGETLVRDILELERRFELIQANPGFSGLPESERLNIVGIVPSIKQESNPLEMGSKGYNEAISEAKNFAASLEAKLGIKT